MYVLTEAAADANRHPSAGHGLLRVTTLRTATGRLTLQHGLGDMDAGLARGRRKMLSGMIPGRTDLSVCCVVKLCTCVLRTCVLRTCVPCVMCQV